MNQTNNIIPGYTGHIPARYEGDEGEFEIGQRNCIPGLYIY